VSGVGRESEKNSRTHAPQRGSHFARAGLTRAAGKQAEVKMWRR
jgi:hypothetical protein